MNVLRALPLFPLHSVLCPGMALPLHIFEPRYREMIGACLEAETPFGVVLIRDGREVGPLAGHIADVGTTAVILLPLSVTAPAGMLFAPNATEPSGRTIITPAKSMFGSPIEANPAVPLPRLTPQT